MEPLTVPILQMRKLRLKGGKSLVQGPIVNRRWGLEPPPLPQPPVPFTHNLSFLLSTIMWWVCISLLPDDFKELSKCLLAASLSDVSLQVSCSFKICVFIHELYKSFGVFQMTGVCVCVCVCVYVYLTGWPRALCSYLSGNLCGCQAPGAAAPHPPPAITGARAQDLTPQRWHQELQGSTRWS